MKNRLIESKYPVSFMEQLNWQKQSLADDLKWHDGLNNFKSEAERLAYEAGYQQGWGKCFNTLIIHQNIYYKEVNE